MSKVLEEMKTRRSIRKFKPDMIPQDILDRIIEAGTFAANGRGAQNTIIIQVTNKEIRDEIAKRNADIMGSNTDPFYGAPVILIVLGKKDWPTHVYDGSLVMGNLMLAAHDLGIGEAAGFTARRKSLNLTGARSFSNHSVLRMSMRESDIVLLDMSMEIILT